MASRLSEIAELLVAIFATELVGSLREPPPHKVILLNFFDHMACERLLNRVPDATKATASPNMPGQLLHQMTNAMETALEILRGRLGISTLSVSPPGLISWDQSQQRFVYLLSEVWKSRNIDFVICAPNLRVGCGAFCPSRFALFGIHCCSERERERAAYNSGNIGICLQKPRFFSKIRGIRHFRVMTTRVMEVA